MLIAFSHFVITKNNLKVFFLFIQHKEDHHFKARGNCTWFTLNVTICRWSPKTFFAALLATSLCVMSQ